MSLLTARKARIAGYLYSVGRCVEIWDPCAFLVQVNPIDFQIEKNMQFKENVFDFYFAIFTS